jgi:hypothetical protein
MSIARPPNDREAPSGHGADLTQAGGFGTAKSEPIQGSFQVLMVGH